MLNRDVDRYISIVDDANANIFNSRFRALWNGNYKKYKIDKNNVALLELELIPNDYERLKKDNEFLYFLRSLKNQYFWLSELNWNK